MAGKGTYLNEKEYWGDAKKWQIGHTGRLYPVQKRRSKQDRIS